MMSPSFPVQARRAAKLLSPVLFSLYLAGALLVPHTAAAAPLSTVQMAVGKDRWSLAVARDWLPRTDAALASAYALLHDQYDISPDQTRHWVIATSAADVVDGAAARILLEAGLTEAELRDRALLHPLRVVMYQAFDRLSAGNLSRLPAWLPSALADTLARESVDALRLPPPAELEKDIPLWDTAKRRPPAPAGSVERVVLRPSPKSRIAMAILRDRLGDRFHRAMKSYLMASGRSDFNASDAFTSQLGISERELAAMAERQWSQRPAPAASAQAGGAAVSPHITVRMGGYVRDGYADRVEQNALPLVRQATVRFDDLMGELWHVRVGHDVTVYLAAGAEDYKQVLAQDMHTKEAIAETESEVSGGMSNRRGQIAIKFNSKDNPDKANQRAVRTTMHELTHQIQYQLADGKSGFRPPHWMMEGPAKLIEYLFSEQMPLGDGEPEAVYAWRQASLKWWRTGNKTGLTPEELVDAGSGPGWLKMMKDHRGNYEMATLMLMYLKAVSGEHFFTGLANYYRLSGHAGQNHQLAFEESFGISESDFVADFKLWLARQ
ncbi:hypothetical protein [Janthinobacterium agaricidamnosum]|uniref:DUF1570 domain-containing protein n=1 Tax=Janthinobacterium agaricidamnosum NBRC 102515 = DSM 9628 TaxID=1349767 RepID=W0VAV8_9BURK|nr:hypothetical protein [Janthinobacterium agaricidamnosum]CDG84478.1 hypothetical protein GJA_3867 [Janthinobacterium agaricidamnosum NBRC 102515 = DSM 9628]